MADPIEAGANEAAELAGALRQPAEWTKDGLGIRGPQPETRSPDADEIRHSDQPMGEVVRESQGGGGKSEGDIESTSDEQVYGAYNGQPASLRVVISAGWRTLEEEDEDEE